MTQKRTILISSFIFMGLLIMLSNSCKEVDQPEITEENTFTDSRDGNIYQTVTIGNQVWMAENLAYLPSVVGPSISSKTNTYYYVYNYDGSAVNEAKATEEYSVYGVLYNWPAAMNGAESSTSNPSGIQGVCPTGWHLPSDSEWTQLTDYLGGASNAGGKLKAIGNLHWRTSEIEVTNETGFTALPGGGRFGDGAFYSIGSVGIWWSSTESNDTHPWSRSMPYNSNLVSRTTGSSKEMGRSVRCIRD